MVSSSFKYGKLMMFLKIQAGSANDITGAVSYALLDRSQENG